MIISTINARGLADDGNRQTLFRALKAGESHVYFLQETSCTNTDSAARWAAQWDVHPNRAYFSSYVTPAGHAARGVAILFSKRFTGYIDTDSLYTSPDGRIISIRVSVSQRHFRLVCLYAPNDESERDAFFSAVDDVLLLDYDDPEADGPGPDIVLGGDFNMVLDPILDRIGSIRPGTGGAPALRRLMADHDLVDPFRRLHPDARVATWLPDRATSGARLDRFYISAPLLECCRACTVADPLPRLDHHAVVLDLSAIVAAPGPGYWKLNVRLLQDEEYLSRITPVLRDALEFLEDHPAQTLMAWDYLKIRVRTVSIYYAKKKALARRSARQAAAEALRSLAPDWAHRPDALAPAVIAARRTLDEATAEELEGAAVRARVAWDKLGERPTRYFCRLEKARAAEAALGEVLTPSGAVVSGPRQVAAVCGDFYRSLYGNDDPIDPVAQATLFATLDDAHKLSPAMAAVCDAELTLDELGAALDRTAAGKTPGIDGLPYEFYKAFWDLLGPTLLRVLRLALEGGSLPVSCRTGVIRLLYKKKGDRRDLRNWRPLTMLCTDYKLLASVLALRLAAVADAILWPTQTGFMRGRHIGANVLLVQMAVRSFDEGCLLFLDQEKAYDRVDWSFLRGALRAHGFGPFFCEAVDTLYQGARSLVSVNGWDSPSFALQRSVRQGDPLSPLLFNVVDNILAAAIMTDPAFRGLPVAGICPKLALSQYADDKTFFVRSAADMAALDQWLQLYCRASGARINWAKSEGMWLAPRGRRFVLPASMSRLRWCAPGATITHLGVPIGLDELDAAAWQPVLDRMEASLASWRHRNLTFRGRVTVLKALATSRLWHVAGLCPLPTDVLASIEASVWSFFWRGRRGAVAREVARLPVDLGGLGVPSARDMISALHVVWLRRLLEPGASPWKALSWSVIAATAPPMFRKNPRDLLLLGGPSGLLRSWSGAGIWPDAFRTWLRIRGPVAPTPPATYDDVLGQPLWFNRALVTATGHSLGDAPAHRRLASHGICHVGDLWSDRLRRFDRPPQCGADNFARLLATIPLSWRQLLARGPVLVPDALYVLPSGPVVEVGVPTVGRLLRASPGDLAPSFTLIALAEDGKLGGPVGHVSCDNVDDLLSMRRLRTATGPDGCAYLDGAPAMDAVDPARLAIVEDAVGPTGAALSTPLARLTVRYARSLLARANGLDARKPTVWLPLLLLPDDFDWRSIWRWASSTRQRTRYQCDLIWKVLSNAIPVGYRFQWAGDGLCPHGCDTVETVPHTFLECRIAQAAWRACLRQFGDRHTLHGLQLSPRLVALGQAGVCLTSEVQRLWTTFHACTLHAIWAARCRAFFNPDEQLSFRALVDSIRYDALYKFERFLGDRQPRDAQS